MAKFEVFHSPNTEGKLILCYACHKCGEIMTKKEALNHACKQHKRK